MPRQENWLNRLPPDERAELSRLRKHEEKILAALESDENLRQLFLRDPGAALAKIGVPVSQRLRLKMRQGANGEDLLKARQFRLPGGQVITPKVTVHITREKEK